MRSKRQRSSIGRQVLLSAVVSVVSVGGFQVTSLPSPLVGYAGHQILGACHRLIASTNAFTVAKHRPRNHGLHGVSSPTKSLGSLLPSPNTSARTQTSDNGEGTDIAAMKLRIDSISVQIDPSAVPRTMLDALRLFWLDHRQHGPRSILIGLVGLSSWRAFSLPWTAMDLSVMAFTIVFWWFQEHWIHDKLLHSSLDWYGKRIHERHHGKDYYHISLDPTVLLAGWLITAHVVLRCILPLPLAISATVAYGAAGLWYEWSHYVVHTKVPFRKGSYWYRMKQHHIRHHLVDDRYWLGFSLPAIDSLMRTNPTLEECRAIQKEYPGRDRTERRRTDSSSS